MKNIFITIITIYQRIISPLTHQLLGTTAGCRNHPTCSAYAKDVIGRYGVGKGTLLALRRILNCQPLFSV